MHVKVRLVALEVQILMSFIYLLKKSILIYMQSNKYSLTTCCIEVGVVEMFITRLMIEQSRSNIEGAGQVV